MGKRHTIEEMQLLAKERGGKCLSNEYINTRTKLKWQCKCGNVWEASPDNIIYNRSWCPICRRAKAARSRALGIDKMNEIAKSRGGKCLSKIYIDNNKKLKWECKYGHQWNATPIAIYNGGQWCPKCKKGVSERICRIYFENIFGVKFPTVKPKWLLNDNGIVMELDGYNKKLGLAFEYHGVQHYKYKKFFHNNEAGFERRLSDDKLKEKICAEKGVELIIVPYTVDLKDIHDFIVEECNNKNIPLPEKVKKIPLDEIDIYPEDKLESMRLLARKRGGKCLSNQFIDTKTQLKWQCKEGHIWNAIPTGIIRGTWCPYCAGRPILTIEDMKSLAIERGGECLSNEYINNRSHLNWRCKEGHEWKTTPQVILQGTWCPRCSAKTAWTKRKRDTIEDMRLYAKKKGGKCLSEEYIDARTKLKWRCKDGHEWMTVPYVVKAGSWCPKCAGKFQTNNGMKKLAEDHGGKCLSTGYFGMNSKLRWQCKEGHEWEAVPSSIKSGKWCPTCGIEKSASKRRLNIEQMKNLAIERGGKCLSDEYIDAHTKLRWSCKEGHEWEAMPKHIKNSESWCPICHNMKKQN